MPEIALALYAVYLATAFGLRSWLQWRRTGHTGFVGLRGRIGSAEWLGGALFAVAVVAGAAAPMLAITGAMQPIEALDAPAGYWTGLVITVAGIAGTLLAQLAMGASWRIGVDPDERTRLVTTGPFALVRNPIFSAMIPVSAGLAMLVPNVVAIAGLVTLVAALELQTRVVEEPYLRRAHGDDYLDYATEVGRFVPALGRLRRP